MDAPRPTARAVALVVALGMTSAVALAQDNAAVPAPSLGSDPRPSPDGGGEAGKPPIEELLDRLRKMEKQNEELQRRIEHLEKERQGNGVGAQHGPDRGGRDDEGQGPRPESGLAGQGGFLEESGTQNEGGGLAGAYRESGASSSGSASHSFAQDKGNRYLGKIPLNAYLDYGRDGVGLATPDQEFLLKFRGELQADSLVYARPSSSSPFQSGLYLPRVRYYFQGHFTRPVEYQLSFQRSYTSFGFLNAFVNFNYDPRLQLRVGRFKVPYTYEWYKLNNWRLITPERSIFDANFALNRQIGVMGWGKLYENRAEYAVGVFDGPRNSEQDFNRSKDVAAFLNFTPFRNADTPLKNLNVGGSMDFGVQDNPIDPAVLRTNVNASSEDLSANSPINNATVPFLQFNSDVKEKGVRELWDLHLAYYYQGLSFIGSWAAGEESFARTGKVPTKIPVNGFFVVASYLITGETLNERTLIDPIRRFDLRPGKFGLGAFEPFARYSFFEMGNYVFTGGFADPNLWTNKVSLVDVGVNWYLNKAVKVYMDWEHAMFGQPVFAGNGVTSRANDLFWLRLQLYY